MIRINLKQIETFYWAARLGSFTAAAARLHTTQSTVSMRIHELEASLGVQLFDRSLRNTRLNAKGRDLVGYAERLIAVAEELIERIAASDSYSGLVRLGVAEVVSLTWLPAFIETLHRRHPNITLEIDEALTADLIDRLRAGKLDIVFAPGKAPLGSSLIGYSLGAVEFRWMGSPELDVPTEPMTPSAMAEFPIISLARESYHYEGIESWFHAGRARCRRIDTCKSMGVMAALVGAGLGVGLLPPRCFSRELDEGKLRILTTDPEMEPIGFSAIMSVGVHEPLMRTLAELATEVSDFRVRASIRMFDRCEAPRYPE